MHMPPSLRPVSSLLTTAVAAASLFLAASAALADTGPRPDLWPRWQAHDPASEKRLDPSAFDAFLAKYRVMGADGVVRIAYGAVTQADKSTLQSYIDELSGVPISTYDRDAQFAYWINLYNAATIDLILDHYPLDSIVDVPLGGIFSFGPWGADILTVEGEAISLNDIEHRILRPIWQDSRVHYVINCASIGCPNVPALALRADDLDRTMEAAARAYVNNPRGARVEDGALTVSSIYVWFESDFVRSHGSVIAHLRAFADPETRERLRGIETVSDDAYDWSLNDATGSGR